MWDSGGMAPFIFNLSTRRGDWSAITVAVLSPKPLDKQLAGLQRRCDFFWKYRNIVQQLLRIETR